MYQLLRITSISILSASLLLTACQPITAPIEVGGMATEAHEAHGEEHTEEHSEEHPVHWSYDGEGGPEQWGALEPENVACSNGASQSPIDLAGAAGDDLVDISFNYGESPLKIHNNGHTVQVDYSEGSSITVDGVTYELKQFHFHTASEHTINGEQYPLELHLVHRSEDDALAVVGVLAKEGAENPAFVDIVANAPADVSEATIIEGIAVAAERLLPAERLYYSYSGSLTTPPCSEGVKWHVLTTPIELSAEQIATLSGILHENFRPIQPLNERPLAVDTAGG